MKQKRQWKEDFVNVLIYLIVLFVVIMVLMLPSVKNWIISYLIILSNTITDFTYAHPVASFVVSILFILLAAVAHAFLKLELDKEN